MPQYYITTVPSASEEGVPARLVFDALTEFSPNFSQRLTSYVISDKSVVSTQLSKNNTKIQASGWISATPVAQYENNLVGYDDLEARPLQTYELLRQWEDEGVELTVSSEYEIFSPVVITSLTPINTGSEAIRVDLTMEVARRVSYKRVRLIQNVTEDKEKDGKNNTSGSSAKDKIEEDGSLFLKTIENFGNYSGFGDLGSTIGQNIPVG